MRALLLWCFLACFSVSAIGAEPRSRIETQVSAGNDVAVGQPVRLLVDIWVTTWFLEAPQLPTLEIPGAAVTLSDSAQHLNDKSGSEPWFGIEREYLVTPLQSGVIQIPAFSIVVKPGPDGVPQTLTTAALTLTARAAPRPAAAGNSLITTQLTARQQIDGDLKNLKAGDSITRTITQIATGTPAMLLTPINFEPIEGLAVYAAPPIVENQTKERIGFVAGRRVDAATYVIQRSGHYTLPAIEIAWWNPQAQQLNTERLPKVTFRAAHASVKNEFEIPGDSFGQRLYSQGHLLGFGAAAILLLLALYRLLKPTTKRTLEKLRSAAPRVKKNYIDSEFYAYHQLRISVKRGNSAALYADLYRWIERTPNQRVTGPEDFAKRSADANLLDAVKKLQQDLFDGGTASEHQNQGTLATTLAERLAVIRRRWLRLKAASKPKLAALNPP